jgi:ADP-ribose pyrophosphatase YjhB (NUDIX family)
MSEKKVMAKRQSKSKARKVSRGTRDKQRKPKHADPRAPKLERGDIEFIARGCLIERSHVLLCVNLKHGYLYLPGGHVEFGESAAGAVAREFLEECGLGIRVGELALVSEGTFATRKRAHHELNLVFYVERSRRAEGGSGVPAPIQSNESWIEFRWVDLSAVVDHDIRPGAAKAWLASLGTTQAVRPEWVSEISS